MGGIAVWRRKKSPGVSKNVITKAVKRHDSFVNEIVYNLTTPFFVTGSSPTFRATAETSIDQG